MYVCLCHAVTESDLALAISEGADSLKSLQAATGAGTGCGSCLGELELWAARARARRFPILGGPSRVSAGDSFSPQPFSPPPFSAQSVSPQSQADGVLAGDPLVGDDERTAA